MMWGYGSAWSPWLMVLGTLLVVAVLAVAIWAVITLARGTQDNSGRTMDATMLMPPQDTPELILERRLARGDIDIETYRATRDAMQHRTG
jgi:putative membrane protein